ncbi:MAG: hypothetical protein EOP56_07220 [Sphingobacteriales bacterium]|nr:MAG: hypothetical protein EOP56_07220 [Sphingobacteriales bacterium]
MHGCAYYGHFTDLFCFTSEPIKSSEVHAPHLCRGHFDTIPGITKISADVIDCPVLGGKLMAAVYDSSGYYTLHVWHSVNGFIYRSKPLKADDAEVVIADDALSLGKTYIFMVTCIRNGRVEAHRCVFTNILAQL